MLRRLIIAALFAMLSALAAGCGSTEPDLSVDYKLPIVPIKFSVNLKGEIKVSYSGTFVTPIGEFSVTPSMKVGATVGPQDDGIAVIIRTIVDSSYTDHAYKIARDRIVKVYMNGEFRQTITDKRVTLEALPGRESVVVVTDEQSQDDGADLSRVPSYVMHYSAWEPQIPDPLGKYHEVDFDARRSESGISSTESDLSREYGNGLYSFKAFGRTELDPPSPEQCLNDAQTRAVTAVDNEDIRVGQMYCVVTDKQNVVWFKVIDRAFHDKRQTDGERTSLILSATLWIKQ